MHNPNSPILTEAVTQQWLDRSYTIRLLMSVLREQSTVRGLEDALDKGARMWNNGMKSKDMGVAVAGVKECQLVLGKLREHERSCRQLQRFARSHWRLRLSWEPFREQVAANGTYVVKRRR